MAGALGDLVIKLHADIAQFTSDMGKAAYVAKQNSERITAALNVAGKAFAALGGGAAAIAWVNSMRQITDTADTLGKLSQRTGIATEALSEYKYAAESAGATFDDLQAGVKKMTTELANAVGGQKDSAALFDLLGVKITDASGKMRAQNEVLDEVAKKFGEFKDGPAKAALAIELFGKSGDKLIPMLNQLESLREEGKKLGAVYGTDFTKAAEQMNDNLARLARLSEAGKIALADAFLPAVVRLTDEMVRGAKEGGKWMAMLRGVQALITGDDQLKADRGVVEGVDRLLAAQKRLAEAEASLGKDHPLTKRYREGIATIEADIKMHQARSTVLEMERKSEEAAAKAGKGIKDAPVVRKDTADQMAELRALEAERRRLTEMGSAAWVKAIEDQFAREKQLQDDAIENAKIRAEEEEEIRKKLREGWVAYAQAIVDEDERMTQAIADAAMNTKEANDIAKDLGLTFSSAFEDAIVKGSRFSDLLKSLSQDIARIIVRESVTRPLASGISDLVKSSGITNSIGSFFKSMMGFATGGDFTVGGSGGVDSQLVAFRATPGEEVSVRRPGDAGSGQVNVVNQFVDVSAEVRAQIAAATPSLIRAAAMQAADMKRRGGSFGAAFG